MAAVASAPGLPRVSSARFELDSQPLSTIRDPRTLDLEGRRSAIGSGASTPHHPDLNTEVATLSNKLISSINHQTILDDALTAASQELETTHGQVRSLEAENMDFYRQIHSGELVRKAEVDRIAASFADDRKRTMVAEQEKKRMETELESLTTSLFEEANEMVSAARKETEATEHRNHQLRVQIQDIEALLANQQEQLAELKAVMEHMNQARADRDGATNSTAPSTPALPSHPDMSKAMEAMQMASAASQEDISPAPPTSFSHLLSPVLRTDLTNYEDFRTLTDIGKKSAPNSRVNSGSYTASAVPGLTFIAKQPSQGSMPGSMPHTPPTGSPHMSPTYVPLKETKFYKRALTEDIEPTLRLDTAPGLSWLIRRSVINSIVEGSLVIEPTPSSTKMFFLPCSLCGEHRKSEEFRRTHRFRTSESGSAQRYPLCAYCLNRMRATCDYISFLRMVKDGHWRTEGVEAEKSAWEESVRLRERMFWARIGGGVVPAFTHTRDSPRASMDNGSKPNTPFSAPPLMQNGSFDSTGSGETRAATSRQRKEKASEENGSQRGRPELARAPQSFNSTTGSSHDSRDRSTSVSAAPTSIPNGATTPLKESLAPKPRSRQASYERERVNTPDRDGANDNAATTMRGSPSPPRHAKTGDQGLQISIPGSFGY